MYIHVVHVHEQTVEQYTYILHCILWYAHVHVHALCMFNNILQTFFYLRVKNYGTQTVNMIISLISCFLIDSVCLYIAIFVYYQYVAVKIMH